MELHYLLVKHAKKCVKATLQETWKYGIANKIRKRNKIMLVIDVQSTQRTTSKGNKTYLDNRLAECHAGRSTSRTCQPMHLSLSRSLT